MDKLTLYNKALFLLGQRKLSAVDEARPPRYWLDAVYDFGAIQYCLEVAKPVFARITTELDTYAVSTEHALDNVYTLPADYITAVAVFSDDKLDIPVNRYIIEGGKLACEHATIYLRYVSNTHITSFTNWTISFSELVAAYLAHQLSIKVAPDLTEALQQNFTEMVKVVTTLDERLEPIKRPVSPTTTLSAAWLSIYNDALQILKQPIIVSNTDDSEARVILDRTRGSGVVEDVLDDVGWDFALVSTKSTYDSALEPSWGYQYVHAHPADMHRVYGVFIDEYMRIPLKDYVNEGGAIFCDHQNIYVQYVDSDLLTTPSSWPSFFTRLIGARMAKDAAPSLEGDLKYAEEVYRQRKDSARSADAQGSPPRILTEGSWNRARRSWKQSSRRDW